MFRSETLRDGCIGKADEVRGGGESRELSVGEYRQRARCAAREF